MYKAPEEQWHFRQEKKAGFMQNTQKILKYTYDNRKKRLIK